MFGRATASQFASASAASFLLVFTYGLTNWGAMSRSVWPKPSSLRAQWWALPHASMPTRHGGKLTKNAATWSRLSCFFKTVLPRSSTTWIWNTFFAKSMPIVVIFMTDAPSRFKWLINASTLAR